MKNLLKSRLIVICGYYGSGKTNIAVNLALTAADCGKGVVIVDLDTVNPYFRTADNAVLLRERGVITLIPEFANTNVDIPALPPAFPTVFERDETVIVDVGGGAEGSAVLGGFRDDFEKCGYDMYYVFNANRPENTDTESKFRPACTSPESSITLICAVKQIKKPSKKALHRQRNSRRRQGFPCSRQQHFTATSPGYP